MNSPTKQAIEWRPDFATGVAIIDDQHRILVNMLNQASVELTDHSPMADLQGIVQGLLRDHILHTDKEFGAFIRDQQNRASAAKR